MHQLKYKTMDTTWKREIFWVKKKVRIRGIWIRRLSETGQGKETPRLLHTFYDGKTNTLLFVVLKYGHKLFRGCIKITVRNW